MSLYNLTSKPRHVAYRFSMAPEINKALSGQKQVPRIPYAKRRLDKRMSCDHPLEKKIFQAVRACAPAEVIKPLAKDTFAEVKQSVAKGEVPGPQKSLLMTLINSIALDPTLLPSVQKRLLSMSKKGIQTDIYFTRLMDVVLQSKEQENVLSLLEEMRQHGIPISKKIYIRILSSWGSKESNFVGINKVINEMKQNQIELSTHTMNCALPAWLGSIVSVMKQSEKSINIVRSCYSFLQRNEVKPNHKTIEILFRYCPTMSQMQDVREIMKENNVEANLPIRIAIAETYFRLGEGLSIVHAMQVHPYQHSDVTAQRGNFERTPFSNPAALVPEISSSITGCVVPELCSAVLCFIYRYGYGKFLAATIWRTMEDMMFAPSKAACLSLLGSYQLSIEELFATGPQYKNVASRAKTLRPYYPDISAPAAIRRHWNDILRIYSSPTSALFHKYLRLLHQYNMCEDFCQEFLKMEEAYKITPSKLAFSLFLNTLRTRFPPGISRVASIMRRYKYTEKDILDLLKDPNEKLEASISEDKERLDKLSYAEVLQKLIGEIQKKESKDK